MNIVIPVALVVIVGLLASVMLSYASKVFAIQEDQLSGFIVDLNLKYDKVFSVIDIDQQTYLKWRNVSPFYQNVDREGIVLWKAA